MADLQLGKLDKFNDTRRNWARKYWEGLKDLGGIEIIDTQKFPGAIWLRYPIIFESGELAEKVFKSAKKQNVILGDWYKTVVAPEDIDEKKTFYQAGSCPVAEEIGKRVLNLPTHFDLKEEEVELIIKLIKDNVGN